MAAQFLVEGIRSCLGALDEVNAELVEVLPRPQPFFAEQRPAVQQASLLPSVGSGEDGGCLLSAHFVSLHEEEGQEGLNTPLGNGECATVLSRSRRGIEDGPNIIACAVDWRARESHNSTLKSDVGVGEVEPPHRPMHISTISKKPATAA